MWGLFRTFFWKVLHAGGILIQALPLTKDNDIKVLEEKISKLDPFSILLRSGLNPEEIIKKTLSAFDVEVLSEFEGLCFYCPCSQERFEGAIAALGKEEIKKIIDKISYAEGTCHFCSNVYMVKKENLEKLYNN